MAEPADRPTKQRLHSQLYVRAPNGVMLRDRQVTRLMVKVRKVMPWLKESDWPAVRGWARLEVLLTQSYAVLRMQHPVDPGTAEPRRLLKDVRQLLIAQLAYERELGMTPLSRASLKASATNEALDLPAIFATQSHSDETDGVTLAADAESQPAPSAVAAPSDPGLDGDD